MNQAQQKRDDSGDQLVVLREVPTRVEADLIEALLRGAGIPCIVHPPSAHDLFSFLHSPGRVITIRVRAGDLERARNTIAEDEETRPTREDDFCPYCGEHLGAATDACPRCARDISEWVALREESPPAPIPAQAREHSTTWRFFVLLALAALAFMLLTPSGQRIGRVALRKAMEVVRHIPMGPAAILVVGRYREARRTSAHAEGRPAAASASFSRSPGMNGSSPWPTTAAGPPLTYSASQGKPKR
jgi:hypothetical protein